MDAALSGEPACRLFSRLPPGYTSSLRGINEEASPAQSITLQSTQTPNMLGERRMRRGDVIRRFGVEASLKAKP